MANVNVDDADSRSKTSLTVAEAVTLLAYGRCISKKRLREWLTRHCGRIPERARRRLEDSGQHLARLMYSGKVSGFGELYRDSERLGERGEIKDKSFLDYAYADPFTDNIIADLDPGEQARLETAFSRFS